MSEPFHHRATLKQSNKSFKSRHKTKGDVKRLMKGKVGSDQPRQGIKAASKADAKLNRKNLAKQIQQQKRQQALDKSRQGRADQGPPRLVVRIR
jgi:pre-rRNA-processing protein TSR1